MKNPPLRWRHIGLLTLAMAAWQQPSAAADRTPAAAAVATPAAAQLDHSGKTRRGKASFYARRFAGRTMADGTPMNPNANIAASKTLPLGTEARVTNLKNGESTVVEIRDRGPYVKGRIVDLSPRAARDIGLGREGVVAVEVAPITVPQKDGSVKRGDGADEKVAEDNSAVTLRR